MRLFPLADSFCFLCLALCSCCSPPGLFCRKEAWSTDSVPSLPSGLSSKRVLQSLPLLEPPGQFVSGVWVRDEWRRSWQWTATLFSHPCSRPHSTSGLPGGSLMETLQLWHQKEVAFSQLRLFLADFPDSQPFSKSLALMFLNFCLKNKGLRSSTVRA